ncbi:FMN-binding negative transcriptional regulator [Niabella aurantiaca]|uniref:FMN-binding negative transcriptional regulator n=1 Tax=Niabella aurantiaca TaxID=379900 RepID=UPI000476B13E|nr:FMN-binding negative transcriptional regulator [Niabella aurantiaca]
MYIPAINRMNDPEEILSFIERFSFGTIISAAADGLPTATHLPFLVERQGTSFDLISHFAKTNPQWKEIAHNKKILVIFQEPHAYISPVHYEKALNVPTWNYIAVHVYGEGMLIREQDQTRAVLDRTVEHYESAYKPQYDRLPEDFKLKMSQGVVAFKIRATAIEGKKKLSQNKTKSEQEKIIRTLSQSKSGSEQYIAEYMQRHLS